MPNYYQEAVDQIEAVKARLSGSPDELTQLEIDSAQADLDVALTCLYEVASVYGIETEA